MQYVAFFLTFSIYRIHLRFICVIVCESIAHLCLNESESIVWICQVHLSITLLKERVSWLFPIWDDYASNCYTHSYISICVNISFNSFSVEIPGGVISGSCCKHIFNFIRNDPPVFQHGCTILCAQPQ